MSKKFVVVRSRFVGGVNHFRPVTQRAKAKSSGCSPLLCKKEKHYRRFFSKKLFRCEHTNIGVLNLGITRLKGFTGGANLVRTTTNP